MRLSGAHPDHLSRVLTTLFEAARTYGTAIRVQLVPGEAADAAGASG
ncbi:hypothetical protein Psi01_85570 [Planobispora siamensis]|uniref:Uncharacterized protein n=1 Tax=Planobispora siamensis TaxID=936338 RepID=A0A8J3SPH9_9ACTN|nr:hypothetical protein Psi01_85570 [Planobispora siamensis]